MTAGRSLVWLLALLLPACSTTGVLIADPDRGYEPDGDRYIRLRLETVQLDVVEGKAQQAAVPGALCLQGAAGPCARAVQFRLPFMAWNGTQQPWPIELGMFQLERKGEARAPAGPRLVPADKDRGTTVALLAPGSGARFDVLVHIAGLAAGDDPLRGEYLLTVKAKENGERLLVKNLSAGSFNQGAQIARFIGAMTLLLLVAAAL